MSVLTGVVWIKNARLLTLGRNTPDGWLRCVDGRIDALGTGQDFVSAPDDLVIDAAGKTALPGFIDVHVHGGVGHEAMDANPDGLRAMSSFYAQHGVTSFLATTWTDSAARIQAALETAAQVAAEPPVGAALLGVHLEGPYLNPERCGAQSTAHIRRALPQEVMPWLEMGIVRLVALAPEYPENHWLIRECVRRAVPVSAAHTAATYAEMQQAVMLGVTQTTHTFNAMTGLHHREPGTLGAALTIPQLRCELIADNIHVHPGAIRLLWVAKGADRVILITDAVRGAGSPDGEYEIDNRTVFVRDGAVRLHDGTLAGSTLTMDRAVANLMAATGESLAHIWPASSLNAATALGMESCKGSLIVGKDADVILVDEHLRVWLTLVAGRVVYQAS